MADTPRESAHRKRTWAGEQACFEAIHAHYVDHVRKAEVQVAGKCEGWTLSATEADYLTDLTDNITLGWFCHLIDHCLF